MHAQLGRQVHVSKGNMLSTTRSSMHLCRTSRLHDAAIRHAVPRFLPGQRVLGVEGATAYLQLQADWLACQDVHLHAASQRSLPWERWLHLILQHVGAAAGKSILYWAELEGVLHRRMVGDLHHQFACMQSP